MYDGTLPPLRDIAIIFGICAAASLIGAIVLLVIAARQIAEIELPENADFFETLQAVPITVPIALDLLDGAFDIFAAPIAWVILELLGLQALQLVTAFEGLIPGTQLIPTMTAAWVIARLMRKKKPTEMRTSLQQYHEQQRRGTHDQIRSGASLADYYRRKALPMPTDDTNSVVDGEYYEEDFDEPDPAYFDEEEWD